MAALTPSSASGIFKERYAAHVVDAIPEWLILLKRVTYEKGLAVGAKFHFPVVLTEEAGFTHGANNAGDYALNGAIAFTTQDAQVSPAQITLVSRISYDAFTQSLASEAAFERLSKMLLERMVSATSKRLEILMLYGGSGLATCASSANSTATKTVVQVSTATWADGIWAGAKNQTVNFYNGSSLISSGADAVFTIFSVDPVNRKLTVTGTATGISDLDTDLAGAGAGVTKIFYQGAYAAEMTGLDAIITNTGTLFNIDAATYDLWKGNSYSAASGPLTFAKLQGAVATAVGRGLDEKVTVLVNHKTWANLLTDQAAARRFDSSYSKNKAEAGAESLVFYSQNGMMEIISHPCVKEGEAFLLPLEKVRRIGAGTSDMMFMPQSATNEEYFQYVPGYNSYEIRLYSNQAIIDELPARAVKITSIVNS
jgi:hypothetical protein